MAKSAFGPYVGWFVIVLVYGWPFAVFHGTARLAVGIPWLVVTILITMAVIGGKKKASAVPVQQKPAARPDVARLGNVSAPRAPSPNVSTPLVADELRKLAGLRDSGVLTEAEFVKQKKRLLG